MKRVFVIFAILTTTACSNQALIASAFPDRETYSFESASGEDVLSYVCEPGASEAETLQRAQAAHGYVDRELASAADAAADQMMRDFEQGEGAFAASLRMNAALDTAAERIVTTAETRFACLLSDVRDS